jgi:hypothetical protein
MESKMSAEQETAASHALAKLRAKVNLLNALLSYSVTEREHGRRDVAELRLKIDALSRRIEEGDRLCQEGDRLRQEAERQLHNEIESLRREREVLIGSTSWRLTRPIRVIGRWLKRQN